MRSGRGMLAVMTLALAMGCTSSTNVAAGVAAYAEGQWACEMTSSPQLPIPLTVKARVVVRDDSSGRVEIQLPGPDAGVRSVSGTWRLAEDRLTVRWDRNDQRSGDNVGPTHGRGLALDADRIEIRGETIRPHRDGDWVPIAVDRGERSVRFRFPIEGGRARMACRRA